MKDLLTILEEYTNEPNTEYAVLITGEWGCGKTFFWKNDISTLISGLIIDGNYFRPIYISLYGYDNVNDIIDQIVIQYYTQRVRKYSLISAIRNLLQKKLHIENFKDIVHSLVRFKNIVICFDDLERTSIPKKDILGYINSLIEHNNFKVIIICDETKIEDDGYNKFKEKTIGITYKFSPDYFNIISSIIDSYKDSKEFHDYLSEKRDIIYNIFKRSEQNNIRVLKHALFNFWKIFNYLFAINHNFLHNYGTEILIFTLIISFEIKAKNPKPEKLREIEAYAKDDYPLLSQMMFERKDGTKIFNQEVLDKYYYDMETYMYTSKTIYKYINYGYFDSREFITDILKKEHSENPELNSIRNVLGRFWTMSDKEFNKNTSNVLDNIIGKGKIENIFLFNKLFLHYLYFIDKELLAISKDELTELFKNGMELAYSNNNLQYNKLDESELYFIDKNKPYDTHYQEIDTLSKHIKDRVKNDWIKDKSTQCFELLDLDINKFIEQINSDELDYLLSKPCFKYFNPEKLFKKIVNLSNKDIITFRNAIENRYKTNFDERDKEEKITFTNLKEKLELYIKGRPKNLSTFIFNELIITLERICNNIT